MADFKVKMHKIRYPLGLCSRPRWKNLQRSPTSVAVFEGSTSKRRERGEWRKRLGRKSKGEERRDEVKGGISSTQKFWCGAPMPDP